MAITYTWKLTSINTKNENDFDKAIVQTRWEKIGTDEEGNVGVFPGATPFTTEGMDPANFVPFDQLTEEIILGWIKRVSDQPHVDQRILEQIEAKKNTIQEDVKFPWLPQDTEI